MIKNYVKIAWRNLLRNKGFSILNISGLAIGMASAILILLWIQNEVSYDRFHKNADRVYQVWSNTKIGGKIQSASATQEVLAPALEDEIPEVEAASRISWGESYLFTVGDKNLKANGNLVDASFLTMFTFPLLKGDAKTSLEDPYSIVLTEKLAKNIFGDEDPMGKLIKVENDENYKVSGILKDLPNNTQFKFGYLMSYNHKTVKGFIDKDWTNISIRTLVLLKPNASLDAANAKIKDIAIKHSGGLSKGQDFLYPLEKLRLYSNFENGIAVGGV